VIVAELPLSLCCHPTFRLHHLIHLIRPTLVPLGSVEALGVTGRVRSVVGIVVLKLADGMVALGAAHARVCHGISNQKVEHLVGSDPIATYRTQGRAGPSSWASSPVEEHSTASRS
jgi:hypothetical protein